MTSEQKSDAQALKVAPRSTYVSPKLRLLGDLCGLTETGSGAMTEGMTGPNCSGSINQQMC